MSGASGLCTEVTHGEVNIVYPFGRSKWALNSLLVTEQEFRRLHELGLVTVQNCSWPSGPVQAKITVIA